MITPTSISKVVRSRIPSSRRRGNWQPSSLASPSARPRGSRASQLDVDHQDLVRMVEAHEGAARSGERDPHRLVRGGDARRRVDALERLHHVRGGAADHADAVRDVIGDVDELVVVRRGLGPHRDPDRVEPDLDLRDLERGGRLGDIQHRDTARGGIGDVEEGAIGGQRQRAGLGAGEQRRSRGGQPGLLTGVDTEGAAGESHEQGELGQSGARPHAISLRLNRSSAGWTRRGGPPKPRGGR
jgi:hypothetical protein